MDLAYYNGSLFGCCVGFNIQQERWVSFFAKLQLKKTRVFFRNVLELDPQLAFGNDAFMTIDPSQQYLYVLTGKIQCYRFAASLTLSITHGIGGSQARNYATMYPLSVVLVDLAAWKVLTTVPVGSSNQQADVVHLDLTLSPPVLIVGVCPNVLFICDTEK